MKIQAVIRTMTVIAGVLAAIGLTSIALAQGASPPDRSQRPAVYVDLYVDRSDDANVSTCNSGTANDCTLRGAINKANGDAANIYTIYFTPIVTNVLLASFLPEITANALWIVGDRGVPRIDAAGTRFGTLFTIQANDVRLTSLSIVNGRSVTAGDFSDIMVITGTRIWIDSNYLGTVPPTITLTSCFSSGVTRNTAYGILVGNAVSGTNASGAGSVYIYNNTIGCHGAAGVMLAGSDYARIGLNPQEEASGNFIGVNAQGLTLTNALDGVAVSSFAADGARANRVGYNIIGGNGRNGILVAGNGTTENAIFGNSIGMLADNTPRGNAQHGIELTTRVFKNVIGGLSGGNVIGANGLDGIQLDGASSYTLRYNYIGRLPSSAVWLFPNGRHGVYFLNGAQHNLQGQNAIGFNHGDGVRLDGSSTANNTFRLDLVRQNAGHGINLQNGAHDNIVGGSYIYSNTGYGVLIEGLGTQRNLISSTVIYANRYDGIGERSGAGQNVWWQGSFYDNGGLGVDRNADADALNVVNPPTATITSVVQASGTITISGTSSLVAYVHVYRVAPDPSGYGEGKTHLGSVFTTSGQWSLAVSGSSIGCYTLLEDVPGSSTSEFSASTCRVFLPTVLK